jgi:hypothetical protein
MRYTVWSTLILGLAIACLAGCGGFVPSAMSVPAASISATPVPSSSSVPAAQFPSFLNGAVRTITPDRVTLLDGKTFDVSQRTMFYQLVKQAVGDLKMGQYVRTTATPQPDGGLLASSIVVPVPATQDFPPFQFPIGGGNLMNTARIKSLAGAGMSISLANGDVPVTFAPDIEIRREIPGSLADVRPGSLVLVVSRADRTDAIEVYL